YARICLFPIVPGFDPCRTAEPFLPGTGLRRATVRTCRRRYPEQQLSILPVDTRWHPIATLAGARFFLRPTLHRIVTVCPRKTTARCRSRKFCSLISVTFSLNCTPAKILSIFKKRTYVAKDIYSLPF